MTVARDELGIGVPDRIRRIYPGSDATFEQYAPGQVLCAQSKPARHVFEVISGALKLFRSRPDGRRQVCRFMGPGDVLGIAEGAARYASTVQAITRASAWRYERRDFAELLRSNSRFEHRYLVAVERQLDQARDHMLLLARMSAMEKVASFLLALARAEGPPRDDVTVALPMTRRDIADCLGLEVETVSRVLTSLQRRGVILLPDADCARVISHESLRTLAGRP